GRGRRARRPTPGARPRRSTRARARRATPRCRPGPTERGRCRARPAASTRSAGDTHTRAARCRAAPGRSGDGVFRRRSGAAGGWTRCGHVEMITCAATHGYLPLLGRYEPIPLQHRAAVETHRRHFGQAPRGIWLPECAYRPRYEWTPPSGRDSGRVRWVRPGIEELLAAHGLEYFVADAHLVSAGPPVFLYRDFV